MEKTELEELMKKCEPTMEQRKLFMRGTKFQKELRLLEMLFNIHMEYMPQGLHPAQQKQYRNMLKTTLRRSPPPNVERDTVKLFLKVRL